MKKITFLLTLLLAFVGVTASAQSLTISDAPNSDGTWASNTQWYLIRVALTDGYHPKAGYLSTDEGYTHTNGLLLTNETCPATDKGLWCIVGDKTNGYKFYNKGEGTTKVLGISETSKWSKMYETSSTGSVAMSFDIANSTADTKAYCVKFHSKSDGDYWWNNSDNGGCHLSYWKDQANSTVATEGNAYYFIPVNDLANVEYNADVFLGTTNVEKFCLIPGVSTACANERTTWEANKTKGNEETFMNAAKIFLDNTYYRVTNCNTSRTNPVLAADANSVACAAAAEKMGNASAVWKFVPMLKEGTTKYGVKLYNVNAQAYLGALVEPAEPGVTPKTPMTTDQTQGGLYSISINTSDNTKGFVLRDGNNGRMNLETNGGIDKWEGEARYYSQVTWAIDVATEFEVALKNVESKSYASVYLPFGVSAVSGAEAYVGKLNTEKNALDMTQVDGVPAGKGFVLVGAANATATLTIGTANNVETDLTGTNTAITLTDATRANYLVFGKNEGTVGFFKPSTSVPSIPANKAYLEASKLTAGAIAMNFGGNTTGVNTVVLGENGVNAPVFDLSGRRVVAPVKGGVYIQNGKKFIK